MSLLIIVIGIGILIGVFAIWFNSPKQKGKRGEDRAAGKLSLLKLFDEDATVLRNVYLPKEDGRTSEIDILYMNAKGIFVIESKNYIGYIFGSDKYREWTVSVYTGKNFFGFKHTEKHRFYNPVWQNRTHVRNLRKYLDENVPVFSIVVFGDQCNLMDVSSADGTKICYQSELRKVIRGIGAELPDVLSKEKIEGIKQKLENCTNVSREVKKEHITQIENRLKDTEHCPVCGGQMVLRTAKTGSRAGKQFYGCSNYPKCKYTRNK